MRKVDRAEPPFLVHEYTEACGAHVVETPIAEAGRFIPITGTKFLIQVRSSDSPERRNFTIGHELGHLMFFHGGMFPWRCDDPTQFLQDQIIEEKVCERVAAALLMPLEVFRRTAALSEPSFASVERVAQTFQVSFSAPPVSARRNEGLARRALQPLAPPLRP